LLRVASSSGPVNPKADAHTLFSAQSLRAHSVYDASSGSEWHDWRVLIFKLHHRAGMGHSGQIDRIPVRQPDATMRCRLTDRVWFRRPMNAIRWGRKVDPY